MDASVTRDRISSSTWQRAVRGVHLVLVVIALASLIVETVRVVIDAPDLVLGRSDGDLSLPVRLLRLFSYFTIDSNIIVLVVATLLVLNPTRDSALWRVVRLDALLSIVITGLITATILAPLVNLSGIAKWTDIGLHYLTPWLTLAAWLVFGPRPRITWSTVGYASIWPACWIAYTFAHGAISDWYPYPFLDAYDIGYPIALRNTAAVVILAGILTVVLKIIDDRLPALGKPANDPPNS